MKSESGFIIKYPLSSTDVWRPPVYRTPGQSRTLVYDTKGVTHSVARIRLRQPSLVHFPVSFAISSAELKRSDLIWSAVESRTVDVAHLELLTHWRREMNWANLGRSIQGPFISLISSHRIWSHLTDLISSEPSALRLVASTRTAHDPSSSVY